MTGRKKFIREHLKAAKWTAFIISAISFITKENISNPTSTVDDNCVFIRSICFVDYRGG